jgi:SP family general alpha glucoside:H+ symporter-like MFS transporter
MAGEKVANDTERVANDTEGDGSTSSILRNAKAGAEKERKMTLLQGIKLYPKAIAWSMLISTCIVMEGYDISLVTNFCECPCSGG